MYCYPGYSSYRVVILTVNVILPTTFQHIYWYTIRVSAIKWPSSVVVKSLLYGARVQDGGWRSAPPTTILYTRSKKYKHHRYINIVKVMHLVEVKHNQ
jgi:hypothetical protein